MIKKWLVIGIILLFVGVTMAPTINFNTVKASQDNDLVEVDFPRMILESVFTE